MSVTAITRREPDTGTAVEVHTGSPTDPALLFIQTLAERSQLANALAKSGMIPQKTPEAALAVMLKGFELGIAPMQAFASIHLISGKPTLSADLMVAIAVQRAGVRLRVVEQTPQKCVIVFSRPGWTDYTSSFTIEEARAAELLSNPSWKKYPRAMLAARCKANGSRMIAPDVLAGMYTPEEMDAPVSEEGEVLQAVVVDSQTGEPAEDPASDAQIDLIEKMKQSHVISADERAGIERRLGNGMTKQRATDAIEWLKTEIAARKAVEKEEREAAAAAMENHSGAESVAAMEQAEQDDEGLPF